jgi:pantothenate synthetase
LERQLVQVERKIAQVSRDQSLSAEAKQEALALYQAQAQMIEAQIQQLQQQQQQQRLARTAAAQQAKDVASSQQDSGPSKIDVVA